MPASKIDIVNALDTLLNPKSFKRKGNNWVLIGEELSKIVNLQKSVSSNSYYINYGYIIKGVPLTTYMHVSNRLASTDSEEQKKITSLLDLGLDITDRVFQLTEVLSTRILDKMDAINNEEDLLRELRHRSHLNDIPLVVKEHFKLK